MPIAAGISTDVIDGHHRAESPFAFDASPKTRTPSSTIHTSLRHSTRLSSEIARRSFKQQICEMDAHATHPAIGTVQIRTATTNGKSIMRFILVNRRTPRRHSTCIECSRSLGSSYVRDNSRRLYCDFDCYLRYEIKDLSMSWLSVTRNDRGPVANYPLTLGTITSLAAASCWCYAIPISAVSISLIEAALRMSELITMERLPHSPR
jgi:hypothetical protein